MTQRLIANSEATEETFIVDSAFFFKVINFKFPFITIFFHLFVSFPNSYILSIRHIIMPYNNSVEWEKISIKLISILLH